MSIIYQYANGIHLIENTLQVWRRRRQFNIHFVYQHSTAKSSSKGQVKGTEMILYLGLKWFCICELRYF